MAAPPVQTASFDELDARTAYLLWKLRVDVFVVEQRCPYPELDGRDLETGTRHLWLEDGDRPIAYVRILDDGDLVRVGRVCVDEGHRGGGLAAQLMQAVLDEIGQRRSVLDAQTHLAGWYTRFGYAVSGPAFLEDGIPHVPMHRVGSRTSAT